MIDRQRWAGRLRTPFTVLGGAVLGILVMLLYVELKPPDGRYTDADIRRLADEQIARD